MTEEEARVVVAERTRTRPAAFAKLESLAALVIEESARQNLISPATIESIWSRHILDSLQLATFATEPPGLWLDVGTGGGFPGLVIAAVLPGDIVLSEPRRRRAEFLDSAVRALELTNTRVAQQKVEALVLQADVISARAVASVEKLLRAAQHCATTRTRWLLPRGRMVPEDVAALKADWKGVFHVEHSITDPDSSILIIDGVQRR